MQLFFYLPRCFNSERKFWKQILNSTKFSKGCNFSEPGFLYKHNFKYSLERQNRLVIYFPTSKELIHAKMEKRADLAVLICWLYIYIYMKLHTLCYFHLWYESTVLYGHWHWTVLIQIMNCKMLWITHLLYFFYWSQIFISAIFTQFHPWIHVYWHFLIWDNVDIENLKSWWHPILCGV